MRIFNKGAELVIVGLTLPSNSEFEVPEGDLITFCKNTEVRCHIWCGRLDIWDGFQYLSRSGAERWLLGIINGTISV